MSYSNWHSGRHISTDKIDLDPQNPRIAPSDRPEGSYLIAQLTKREDVLGLAKSISENGGFFPTDPILVIKDGQRFIAIDGNRRLAACKLLLDVALAPTDLRDRFRALAETMDVSAIKRLPTIIAPNRLATIPILI